MLRAFRPLGADLDSGPVVAQTQVRILPRDDADSLAERVLEAEHALYPAALEAYALAMRDQSEAKVIADE